jgi:hypothetical protein
VAGWSYPDWKGIVYPAGRIDQLQYLSSFVDCIEINSTFYRPPDEKNSKSWLARTSAKEDFFFTAKLHRDFTHEGKFDLQTVKQFHDGFTPMLEAGKAKGRTWETEDSKVFFELIRDHTMQGFYGSPRHGGNWDYVSYRMLGLDYPQIIGQNRYKKIRYDAEAIDELLLDLFLESHPRCSFHTCSGGSTYSQGWRYQ